MDRMCLPDAQPHVNLRAREPVHHAGDMMAGTCNASAAQQRIWKNTRSDPATVNYNLPFAWVLGAPLDVVALERAFDDVVRRHESLRTVFAEHDGSVRQVVLDELKIPFARDTAAAGGAEGHVRARLAEEANQRFSLGDGPLLRVGLIAAGDARHVLFLTVHHIIFDRWSAKLLFEEVSALYEAHTRGAAAGLPARPTQYRTYVSHHEEWMRSPDAGRELEFWRTQLREPPPILYLPSRDGSLDRAAATKHWFELPESLSRAVSETARQYQVTSFMFLLAGFKILLQRYTGHNDICVASSVAGRGHLELESIIGLLTNAVMIRTTVRPAESCPSFVQQVRASAVAAYEHHMLPFHEVLAAAGASSAAARRRYQIWFNGATRAPLEVAGVEATKLRTAPRSPGRYLSFSLTDDTTDGRVRWSGEVEYNPNLVSAATVLRMVAHFEQVLVELCANRRQTIAEVGGAIPGIDLP